MSLAPTLARIAADHEYRIDVAHETAANQMVWQFQRELERFNLKRHTLTIGSYGLLVDGDHLHNLRVSRTDHALSQVLWEIDTAVAESTVPNRYFKDRVLSEGQRGKV
jgi:hypothetical protein